MELEDKSKRGLAYDPKFRELLGPIFHTLTDDELAEVIQYIFDAMRDAVEDCVAKIPLIDGLFIRV